MCSLSFVSIVSRRSKILLMSCPWDRITPSMIVVFSSVSRMCVAVSFLAGQSHLNLSGKDFAEVVLTPASLEPPGRLWNKPLTLHVIIRIWHQKRIVSLL